MTARRLMNRLFYFTTEDESILAETYANFERDFYAIAYKVEGTDDVFVTTEETKEAMDRNDVPHTVLAEEDASRVALFHTPQSREELTEHEDGVKALTLAYRAVAAACVGRNGESDLGFDLSESVDDYSYFTAPAGHTYIFRIFANRDEAKDFMEKFTAGEEEAVEWAENIPLESPDELTSFG